MRKKLILAFLSVFLLTVSGYAESIVDGVPLKPQNESNAESQYAYLAAYTASHGLRYPHFDFKLAYEIIDSVDAKTEGEFTYDINIITDEHREEVWVCCCYHFGDTAGIRLTSGPIDAEEKLLSDSELAYNGQTYTYNYALYQHNAQFYLIDKEKLFDIVNDEKVYRCELLLSSPFDEPNLTEAEIVIFDLPDDYVETRKSITLYLE